MAGHFATEIEKGIISRITEGALAVLNNHPEIECNESLSPALYKFVEGALEGREINLITDFDSTITDVPSRLNCYTCIDNLIPETPMRKAFIQHCAYQAPKETVEQSLVLSGLSNASYFLKNNEDGSNRIDPEKLDKAIEELTPRDGISDLLQLFTQDNSRVVVVSAGIMEVIQAFFQTHFPKGFSPIIIANSISSPVDINNVITKFNKPGRFNDAPSIRQLEALEGSPQELNLPTCIQIGDKPEDLKIVQEGIRIGIGVSLEDCDILLPANCSMEAITEMFRHIFEQINIKQEPQQ